jgi:hypothetical protein
MSQISLALLLTSLPSPVAVVASPIFTRIRSCLFVFSVCLPFSLSPAFCLPCSFPTGGHVLREAFFISITYGLYFKLAI